MNVAPARIVPPVIPCVCVSEQLFQWVRAQIPLILKIFSYIQIHLDLSCSWWFMMNLFAFEFVLDSRCFFSWFCWIVFEYVWIYIFFKKKNTPNIRLKPDGLWTSLQLPTILQNPHASLPGKFSRTSPTFPGATLWPALVFHLLGIDGRGIGISDDFWFLGCDMGLKENEKNYICHIKQYKTYIHHIV